MVKYIYKEFKSVLNKLKFPDSWFWSRYTLNTYSGCAHACIYCDARSQRYYIGDFENEVIIKTDFYKKLDQRFKRARTLLPDVIAPGGVNDAYQPIEREYQITRMCLEILSKQDWPITIQTKSPLVLRDLDLLMKFSDLEAGLTITTADEDIRKIFESNSPAIDERIEALEKLHSEGVKTYAMIAPLLPGTEELAALLSDKVDRVLIDRMNYHHADWVYKKYGLEYAITDKFFTEKKEELARAFERKAVPYQLLF